MKRIAKRQFFLLGCASLAAMLLSLYDRYGIVLTSSSRSFLAEQSQLQEQVLRENQEKGGNRSTGQSGKESKTMAENKAGAETETAEKDERMASDANPDIRVLLCSDNYASEYHDRITITADVPFRVSGQGTEWHYQAGEQVELTMQSNEFLQGDLVFTMEEDGVFQLPYLKRAAESPSYEGSLQVEKREEGLILINTLPLETYLCYVVPSEMPSSYPIEALKAQAVCARSYAYCHMEGQAYPEYRANVDDSTAYQVYGNSKEQEKTIAAVDATRGEKLLYQGKVVKAYYFSTSCGRTTNVEAWGTKVSDANSYLKAVKVEEEGVCYEQDLPWFSWNCDIPVDTLSNLFGLNTGQDVGTISQIEITRRGEGEVALEMKVTGDKGTATIQTENKIRSALGGSGYEIKKQDGSVAASAALLPSAFFTIEKNGASFHLEGGGYGHGIGMSQNGANEMAKRGKDYKAILKMFYNGVEIAAN